MGHQQFNPCRGPLDGLIIISVVVCLGPDGNGVYANGIRISSQLERRVERPTHRGRLALYHTSPQKRTEGKPLWCHRLGVTQEGKEVV